MRRLVCLVLCIVLVCPCFSGCFSKGRDRVVAASSPWYSLVQFEVCSEYASDPTIDYYETDLIGVVDSYLYYLTTGAYEIPADVDYSTIDIMEYNFTYLDVYDLSGSLYRTVDLDAAVASSGMLPSDATAWFVGSPSDFHISDGKVYVLISATLFPSWETNTYTMVYDLESSSVESISLTIQDENTDSIYGIYDNGLYQFEGYTVETFTRYSVDYPSYIHVVEPDGTETTYSTDSLVPELSTPAVSEVIYLGRKKAIVGFWNANYLTKTYYEMNLSNGSISPYTEDTSWFSNYFTSCSVSYFDDIGYIVSDSTGLRKLDFKKKKVVDHFSFDSCNINRYDAKDLDVVSITDDQIILSGTFYRSNGFNLGTYDANVYVLTKESSNPNAGKKILYAATLTEFDYTFCEAVCSFNATSSEYFISLDTQYSLREKYLSGEIDTYTDGYDESSLEAQSALSSQLSVDLMAGDGPDIIMDGASMYQLNRSDYLLDLSSYVSDPDLFSNVMSAATVDGALYQVPLTFGINGIVVRSSDVGADQVGFTFSEYESFVDTVCNGSDPIGLSRNDYFVTCLSALNDECFSGGTVSYSSPSVSSLASYVASNVFDPVVSPEDSVYDFYAGTNSTSFSGGEYLTDISFGSLLYSYPQDMESLTVVGIPSPDGRGPMLSVSSSVGVSATTSEPSACVDFVLTLLSSEIQTDYGTNSDGIPVRISSFEASSETLLSEKNADITAYLGFLEAYGLHDDSVPQAEISSSVISSFESVISSCSAVASLDPSVMIIVKEEMPAYFEGQKTLEEVVSVMENRTQTFMDERG